MPIHAEVLTYDHFEELDALELEHRRHARVRRGPRHAGAVAGPET